jgi:hypothetical protein
MLRKLFGVAAGVAALSAVPLSIHAPEAGGIPAPAVNDLSCAEKALCCFEPNSICLAEGDPQIDRIEAKGGRCK